MKFNVTISLLLLLTLTLVQTIPHSMHRINQFNSVQALSQTCNYLLAKQPLEDIKCDRKYHKNEMKFICTYCQIQIEQLRQEKKRQQLEMIEEQRNQIYRTHLANRVKSSILKDILTIRY